MITDPLSLLTRVADTVTLVGPRREVWRHQSRWREAFVPGLEWAGVALDWEGLLRGASQVLQGGLAIAAAREVLANASCLFATARLGTPPLYRLQGISGSFVDAALAEWEDDLYVTDSDYAWSFVLTHEAPQFGPFHVVAV